VAEEAAFGTASIGILQNHTDYSNAFPKPSIEAPRWERGIAAGECDSATSLN